MDYSSDGEGPLPDIPYADTESNEPHSPRPDNFLMHVADTLASTVTSINNPSRVRLSTSSSLSEPSTHMAAALAMDDPSFARFPPDVDVGEDNPYSANGNEDASLATTASPLIEITPSKSKKSAPLSAPARRQRGTLNNDPCSIVWLEGEFAAFPRVLEQQLELYCNNYQTNELPCAEKL
jgi:hypothetical protein